MQPKIILAARILFIEFAYKITLKEKTVTSQLEGCLLRKFFDWLDKNLSPIVSGMAILFGYLWEKDFAKWFLSAYPKRTGLFEFFNTFIPLFFFIFITLTFVFSLFRYFTKSTILKLESDLNSERGKVEVIANNIETLVNGLLLKLSEKIKFSKGEPSRITIYIHNSNGGFISFGRYTPDPSYSGKGRDLLPDNQGCISTAWSADWCYEGNLTYKESKKKYKVIREAYEPQRMRSVFFAVKRIDNLNRVPLAVLVVESKTENRFTEAYIKDILDNEESYFAEIIGCLKNHIPNPQEASARGF